MCLDWVGNAVGLTGPGPINFRFRIFAPVNMLFALKGAPVAMLVGCATERTGARVKINAHSMIVAQFTAAFHG